MPRRSFDLTLLPSAWAPPLVTSGMAITPPVPVDAVRPVPSRLNHVSIVNLAAFKPGAGPDVTRLLTPSKRSAELVVVELTVTVAVSLTLNWPSLTVRASTYVPLTEKVAVVAGELALANVTVPGPLTLLHAIARLLSMSVAVPASDAAAGRVTVRSGPALTTGASLTAVIVIETVATFESRAASRALNVMVSAPFAFAL